MLDDNFPEFLNSIDLNPPKLVRAEAGNGWRGKMIVLGTTIYVLLLYWFDMDLDLWTNVLLVGMLVVFGVQHLLERNGFLGKSWRAYHFSRTLVCVKCKHHWVERKNFKGRSGDPS